MRGKRMRYALRSGSSFYDCHRNRRDRTYAGRLEGLFSHARRGVSRWHKSLLIESLVVASRLDLSRLCT